MIITNSFSHPCVRNISLHVKIVDLTIPSSGHQFINILVSFLTVARVQITYSRFTEARVYLGACFKSCRELMQYVAVLTMQSNSVEAKDWRESVAEHIIATLRVTVAAIEVSLFLCLFKYIIEVYLTFFYFNSCLDTKFSSHPENDPYDSVPSHCVDDMDIVEEFISRQKHYRRTPLDEALRAPLVFASSLRKLLLKPRESFCLNDRLSPPEELKLLNFVTLYCTSFHGLNKLITTPFSFPLTQMSRTILFFWVFTLPMTLMIDSEERYQVAVVVFFVTYGFVGLEYVSIELDDPFGEDANDINSLSMAQAVYEDIYLTLYQMDGREYAERLRCNMKNPNKKKKVTSYGSDKNV